MAAPPPYQPSTPYPSPPYAQQPGFAPPPDGRGGATGGPPPSPFADDPRQPGRAPSRGAPGVDVVIVAAGYRTPQLCCRCEAPQQTTVVTSHYEAGTRTTRTAQMPYCHACAARRKAIGTKRTTLTLLALAVAIGSGLIGLVLPMLPLTVLIVLPIVLSIGVAIALTTSMAAQIATPQGAWMFSFSGARTSYHCANASWGAKFAALNGAQPIGKTRDDGFRAAPAIVAGILSTIVTLIVAFGSHPNVYVDNAGKEPQQLWIDGRESIVVAPKKGLGDRDAIRISAGTHKLGWSPVGAKKPRDEVEAKVDFFGDHLINPDEQGCYFLDAVAYGSSSTSGIDEGPVPIKAFYTFKRVDSWFKENPTSVSTKGSGATRVSLQPYKMCEQLREHACSKSVRVSFVKCSIKAGTSESAIDACWEKAGRACEDDAED